jgi:predicted restriction endonuclease
VRFRYTQPHHVIWWENGGPTDFANMLPLCDKHHHCVHDKGWRLRLGPNRELDVILPDGQVMSTGPPRQQAA